MINYEIISKDFKPPWKLDMVKKYLRITHDHDDDLLNHFMASAIGIAENICGISILKHNIRAEIYYRDLLKLNNHLKLKYAPAKKIDNIKYSFLNIHDNLINAEKYSLHHNNEIIFKPLDINYDSLLKIEYISGYGDDIPPALSNILFSMIERLYEKNDIAITSMLEIKAQLSPFRNINI